MVRRDLCFGAAAWTLHKQGRCSPRCKAIPWRRSDAVRDLGDPSVVADSLRQDWEHSDVPAGLKQLGTAGLAGLQFGTRLGKML